MQRRRQVVRCLECRKNMSKASLPRHMLQQHLMRENKYSCREAEAVEKYGMEVKKGKFNSCPVKGCSGGGRDKFKVYRLREDGILPRYELC